VQGSMAMLAVAPMARMQCSMHYDRKLCSLQYPQTICHFLTTYPQFIRVKYKSSENQSVREEARLPQVSTSLIVISGLD
jgi:hypothetical protein